METTASKWKQVTTLDWETFKKIYENYEKYFPDSDNGYPKWINMIAFLSSGLLLVRPGVWVSISNIVQGMKGEIHIGLIGIANRDIWDDEAREVIRKVMDKYDLPILQTYVPEHFDRMIKFVERIGLLRVGIDPMYAKYNGEAKNAYIYVLRRSQL